MKVETVELSVVYRSGDDLIQFRQYTAGPVDVSILDKEQEERTGETTVTFDSIRDLRACLEDFRDRFDTASKKRAKKQIQSKI